MKLIFLLAALLFLLQHNQAQNIGIGTNAPSPSAQLDISSNNKGFLMPRLTTAQRDLIANPATGLQIFNTDDNCTDIFDGTNWIKNCGYKQTGTATIPEDKWTKKINFGGEGRIGAVGFSIGNRGYIGTGYSTAYKSDFWEFNPATEIWSQKADFGGGLRSGAVGFSIGQRGYIGTGTTTGDILQKDFWEYNPSTNTWLQKADFTGEARESGVGFSITNKGYIGTGVTMVDYKNDFFEFDPESNSWTQKASLPGAPRFGGMGFSIGPKGYIGTGHNNSVIFDDFWEYNASLNNWTQKADVGGSGRIGAVGFSIGLKGYYGTGLRNAVRLKDFWEYNPSTNIWTQKANAGTNGRAGGTGFSIGYKGYIGTGLAQGSLLLNDFWEYNSQTITFNTYTAPQLPYETNISSGIWTKNGNKIYNSDNSVNAFLGINEGYPQFPLNFSSFNGDKISLFGNTADAPHYGFGIQDNLLQIHTATNTQQIAFGFGNSAAFTEKMRITGNGNVGIGTNNPSAKLSVSAMPLELSGSATNSFMKLNAGSLSSSSNIFDPNSEISIANFGYKADNSWNVGLGIRAIRLTDGSNANTTAFTLGYDVDNAIRYANAFIAITGTGNVGIGIKNPSNKLSVAGGANFSGNVGIANASPNAPLQFENTLVNRKIVLYEYGNNDNQFLGFGANGNTLRYQSDNPNADHVFFSAIDNNNSKELMRIRGNGTVGIGTSYTNAPLTFPSTLEKKITFYPANTGDVGMAVFGNDFRIYSDNINAKVSFGYDDYVNGFTELANVKKNGVYAMSVNGSLWVNGTTYASDKRFKKNIKPLDNSLEKVLQLNGVSYQMNRKLFPAMQFDESNQIGLIAQDVEKIVPEVVNTRTDGYKAIDYAKLTPLLIESIKEQQKQIDQLKADNLSMKKMIEKLQR